MPRIQHGRFGVVGLAGGRVGPMEKIVEVGRGRLRELRAHRAADSRAQARFPVVNDFQERGLMRRAGHASTELVRVFELLEELQGVVDAVDAEIERIHVRRAERHTGRAVRAEGVAAAQGKIRLVFRLPQAGRRHGQQEQHMRQRIPFHDASLRMFQRYTPRKLRLRPMGLHCGSGNRSSSGRLRRRISPGSEPSGPVWYTT